MRLPVYSFYIVAILIFCSCINPTGQQQNNSISGGKVILEILSPDENRTAKIYESWNENSSQTQVLVEFGAPHSKGGGGAFTAEEIHHNISLKWIDNNTLQINYPDSLKLYPIPNQNRVQLFNEYVDIIRNPIK